MRSSTVAYIARMLMLLVTSHGALADQRTSPGSIPSFDSAPQTSATPTPVSDVSVSAGNPLWSIPLASLTATRERPLFSRSRRPPAPPAQPARVEPTPVVINQPTRPLFTLLGAITGDADGIAILIDDSTKNIMRMKIGETFSGWTLRTVGKRSATFEMARQVAILVIPPP